MTTDRTFDTIHEAAMELARAGDAAKAADKTDAAVTLYRAAMELEAKAAAMEPPGTTWHFTLHRSAAWLAFQAGEWDRAGALASDGLDGLARADRSIPGRERLLWTIRQRATRAQAGDFASEAARCLDAYRKRGDECGGGSLHPHDGALVAAIDAWHEADATMLTEAEHLAEEGAERADDLCL
jgi:hypothetical protein